MDEFSNWYRNAWLKICIPAFVPQYTGADFLGAMARPEDILMIAALG
jgi:hypothetical protein